MGINKLFDQEFIRNNTKNINDITMDEKKFDCLYIDFTSIPIEIKKDIENDINYLLYDIIDENITEKGLNIAQYYNFKYNSSTQLYHFKNFKHLISNRNNLLQIYINKLLDFMFNLCNKIDKNSLKEIIIGLEGQASMSKISEQRRKNYTKYVEGEIKQHIKKSIKYSEYDEKRKLYNENMFNVSINIYLIDDYIKSDNFFYNIKDKCKQLRNITVLDRNIYGEAEKKIVNYLLNSNIAQNKILIFTPDSDVIILSMIAQTKKNLFVNIVKYSGNNKISIIDCNNLQIDLYNYVIHEITNNNLLHMNYIIRDICLIITLFGNDFIPKFESIDIYDLNYILKIYRKVLLKNNKFILHNLDNTINYDVLAEFFRECNNVEKRFMQNKWLYTLKNINELKILFTNYSENIETYELLITKIINYMIIANSIFSKLKNNIEIEQTDLENYKKVIFVELGETEISDKLKIKIQNKTFIPKIRFEHYDFKVDDSKIKDKLLHPNMNVIKKDRELYKFNNKIDEFKKFIANYDLSNLSINIKSNLFYNLVEKPVNKTTYYKTFFNATSINDINTIVKNYITGIFWTFDNYFNKTNNSSKYVSTWFYPYSKTPLMQDIVQYIDTEIHIPTSFISPNNIKRKINNEESDITQNKRSRINIADITEEGEIKDQILDSDEAIVLHPLYSKIDETYINNFMNDELRKLYVTPVKLLKEDMLRIYHYIIINPLNNDIFPNLQYEIEHRISTIASGNDNDLLSCELINESIKNYYKCDTHISKPISYARFMKALS